MKPVMIDTDILSMFFRNNKKCSSFFLENILRNMKK